MHINHTCLSATISDLNRLFATPVSGAYRQCLNQNCLIFWKDHRKHLWITVLARLFLPKRKRSKITKRNEHIDIHHHHHQMHQKNILLFNLLINCFHWLFSFSLNWYMVEIKRDFFTPWIAVAGFLGQVVLWTIKIHITLVHSDKWIEKKVFCPAWRVNPVVTSNSSDFSIDNQDIIGHIKAQSFISLIMLKHIKGGGVAQWSECWICNLAVWDSSLAASSAGSICFTVAPSSTLWPHL